MTAVCRVTGGSPPANPAPATDTPTIVTPSLGAASTAGTIALDTAVKGVWMVTMATPCWGQVTTAVPACVPTAPSACGSSREVVTVATTPSRPSVSATLDTEVLAVTSAHLVTMGTPERQGASVSPVSATTTSTCWTPSPATPGLASVCAACTTAKAPPATTANWVTTATPCCRTARSVFATSWAAILPAVRHLATVTATGPAASVTASPT